MQKTAGVKEVIGIMGDFWRLFLKREFSQKYYLSVCLESNPSNVYTYKDDNQA